MIFADFVAASRLFSCPCKMQYPAFWRAAFCPTRATLEATATLSSSFRGLVSPARVGGTRVADGGEG
jgi:hypothetical protein